MRGEAIRVRACDDKDDFGRVPRFCGFGQFSQVPPAARRGRIGEQCQTPFHQAARLDLDPAPATLPTEKQVDTAGAQADLMTHLRVACTGQPAGGQGLGGNGIGQPRHDVH